MALRHGLYVQPSCLRNAPSLPWRNRELTGIGRFATIPPRHIENRPALTGVPYGFARDPAPAGALLDTPLADLDRPTLVLGKEFRLTLRHVKDERGPIIRVEVAGVTFEAVRLRVRGDDG